MNKLMLMVLFSLLLVFPTFVNALEVDDLREHAFLVLNFANDSYIISDRRWFVVNNPNKRQQYLTMQLIPIPSGVLCYGQHDDCDPTGWDTNFVVNYADKNGITNQIFTNTSSCWNWWNVGGLIPLCDPVYNWWDIFQLFPQYYCETPSQIDMLASLEENKTLCPVVSIPFSPEDEYFNVSFNMTPSSGAKPNLNVRVFDYSTAYTDKPTQYSTTANGSILALAELIIIQMNLTKLLYYSLIITLVVLGILVFIGGIPLIIKWIMSKLVR